MATIFQKIFRFDHVDSLRVRVVTVGMLLTAGLLLTIGAVYLPFGRYVSSGVAAAIVVGTCYEVARLFARDDVTLRYRPVPGAIVFLLLALPAAGAFGASIPSIEQSAESGSGIQWGSLALATAVAAQALVIYITIEGRTRLERAAGVAQQLAPAFLLVSVSAPQLIIMASLPRGVMLLWFTVATVATNDAAAYFVGKRFGSVRVAPALSPNKTVEGSVAGLLGGSLGGGLFWILAGDPNVPMSTVALVCFLATLSAQSADLMKSYLKRLRGVKDTGSILPGHGGILDRFDALIGAAPVVVTAVSLFGL